jgi:hypothetical protein
MKNALDLDIVVYPPRLPVLFSFMTSSEPSVQDGLEGQNELARTVQKVMKRVKEKVENYFSNSVFGGHDASGGSFL